MTTTLTTLRAALEALEMLTTGTQYVGDTHWKVSNEAIEIGVKSYDNLRDLIASMEAQPEQKPVAWLVFDEDGLPEHATIDPQMAQDHINEAIQEFDFMQAAKWTVRPVYTHPAQPSEPKAEPSDDLVVALAEVRDLFPMPEHGSPIEREWASAMADPCSVPDYVRACIAQPKAEPVQEPWGYIDEYGEPTKFENPKAHKGLAYENFQLLYAAPQAKAEPARLPADERQGFIAAIADRDSIIKALLGQSVEKAIESKIRGDV